MLHPLPLLPRQLLAALRPVAPPADQGGCVSVRLQGRLGAGEAAASRQLPVGLQGRPAERPTSGPLR